MWPVLGGWMKAFTNASEIREHGIPECILDALTNVKIVMVKNSY